MGIDGFPVADLRYLAVVGGGLCEYGVWLDVGCVVELWWSCRLGFMVEPSPSSPSQVPWHLRWLPALTSPVRSSPRKTHHRRRSQPGAHQRNGSDSGQAVGGRIGGAAVGPRTAPDRPHLRLVCPDAWGRGQQQGGDAVGSWGWCG